MLGMVVALCLRDDGATAFWSGRRHGALGLAAVRRPKIGSSTDGNSDDAGSGGGHRRSNAAAQEKGQEVGGMGARQSKDGVG